jgi:hypothetical protein
MHSPKIPLTCGPQYAILVWQHKAKKNIRRSHTVVCNTHRRRNKSDHWNWYLMRQHPIVVLMDWELVLETIGERVPSGEKHITDD